MAFIYLLTNTQNGKRYVGKTVRPLEVRWQGHLGSARRDAGVPCHQEAR
jgi:predicted GIY-YIG superfamily endonuclease